MTYILGLKQPGLNAIITDARTSRRTPAGYWDGQNSALKTGLLFRGCIFARAGNDYYGSKFIRDFRSTTDGVTDTVAGFWRRFEQFVEMYEFPTHADDSFLLLLSERSTGMPEFHVMDSSTGLSTDSTDHDIPIVSYGSGKTILDKYVTEVFSPRLRSHRQYLMQEQRLTSNQVVAATPFFLCLWLSELSTTFEASTLEEHQVGGVFHFVKQTGESESPQQPALYIFSAADRIARAIYSWTTRVVYIQGGLYIERHSPSNQQNNDSTGQVEKTALFDVASRPDIINIPKPVLEEQINQELTSIPFYAFCGFGFTPPIERNSYGFVFKPDGKRQDIFDSDGRLTPKLAALVASNFST